MDVIQLGAAAVMRAAVSTIPLFAIVAAITLLGRRWLAPWARQMLWSLVLVRLMLPISFESAWSLQPSFAKGIGLSTQRADPPESADVVLVAARTEQVYTLAAPEAMVSQHSAQPEVVAASDLPPHATVRGSRHPIATVNATQFVANTMLPLALLTGAIVALLWTAITSLRLWRWVRHGQRCDREDLYSLLSEGQRRLGVSGAVTLWTVPGLAGPATYGWWNPTILLPEDVDAFSPLELKHVLWHELAHIRRYDVLLNWGLALVRAVHWWNPMFWVAQRAWLAERELACDALVLAQLEDQGVRQYGETLLKFIERLSKMGSRPTLAAPGFVSFWGRQHEAKRRLSQLAKLGKPERTWCVWLSAALIASLGLAGLSDASPHPVLPLKSTPLELPLNTTWNMAPVPRVDDLSEPRTRVEYDLAKVIDRLCRDDGSERGIAAHSTCDLIDTVIRVRFSPARCQEGQKDLARYWSCSRQGETLQANGTAREHAEVQQLLELWRISGQGQIRNEIRVCTTTLSLADLLPAANGQVIGGEDATFEHSGVAAHAKIIGSAPLFQAVLSEKETASLVSRLQQDARSNIMLAPRIHTFNGQMATFGDSTARPFITGLRDVGKGAHQPHISVINDGVGIQVRATTMADGETVRMAIAYEESHIDAVEVLETTSGGQAKNIQIPHVSRSQVSVDANVPSGHTLVLVPLRRNDQGQLQLHLFSSKVITYDTAKN